MRVVLFKCNQHLKLYIIFCILQVLMIYDLSNNTFFPNKCKPAPNKFWKNFLYNSEDNNVPIIVFDVYFDL